MRTVKVSTPIRLIDRLVGGISSVLANASVVFTLALMVVMLADVLTRTFTGASLVGSLEVAQTLLVAIVFFGISYAERHGDNVRVQLLQGRVPERVLNPLRSFGTLVAAAVAGVFAYATFQQALHSIRINEFQIGLIQYPLWPARALIVIGFVMVLLEFVMTFLRNIGVLSSATPSEGTHLDSVDGVTIP